MLRTHDTSAAHSDIYKELGMEKYCSEQILTDWKQEDENALHLLIILLGWLTSQMDPNFYIF